MLFVRRGVEWVAMVDALATAKEFASAQKKEILSVQLGLHPRVNFCHPANKPARAPMMFFADEAASGGDQPQGSEQFTAEDASLLALTPPPSGDPSPPTLLRFMRSMGSLDWNYPFSLAGGLYRLEDVMTLMRQVDFLYAPTPPKEGDEADPPRGRGRAQQLNHPNRMETVGNAVMSMGARAKGATIPPPSTSPSSSAAVAGGSSEPWRSNPRLLVPLSAMYPWSSCPLRATMVVVTVNRVQDEYANPVYAPPAAAQGNGEGTGGGGAAEERASSAPTTSGSGDGAGGELSADELLRMWHAWPHLAFDLAQYQSAAAKGRFTSVHVGEFFVREQETK